MTDLTPPQDTDCVKTYGVWHSKVGAWYGFYWFKPDALEHQNTCPVPCVIERVVVRVRIAPMKSLAHVKASLDEAIRRLDVSTPTAEMAIERDYEAARSALRESGLT